jgi:DNA-binding XRE family transcriptional regulator
MSAKRRPTARKGGGVGVEKTRSGGGSEKKGRSDDRAGDEARKAAPRAAVPVKRRLRIPDAREGANAAHLSTADVAFITEEIAQREAHGWSQEEVARRAGVRRGTLQHVEHFRRGLSLRLADAISRVFGSTIQVFIERGKEKIFGLFFSGCSLEMPGWA